MAIKKPTNQEVNTQEAYPLLNGYTDKDGVFHTDFECREMDGNDEEAIAKNEIKINGGKILRTLIERCCTRIGSLVKEDMKPTEWREIIQDLPVAEQDIIVLKIRALSVGDELELNHQCPHCQQKLVTFMDLDEIEKVPYNGIESIEFTLPKGLKAKDGSIMKEGHMRRPIGIDREVLDPIARKNLGMANTLLLSRCVTDIEGNKVNDQMIRDMSKKDRDYLLATLQENVYGLKLEAELTCSSCGETFNTTLNVVNFI